MLAWRHAAVRCALHTLYRLVPGRILRRRRLGRLKRLELVVLVWRYAAVRRALRHPVKCLAELHAHELIYDDLTEVAGQVLVARPKVSVDSLLEDALLSDPGLLEDSVYALNSDNALVY